MGVGRPKRITERGVRRQYTHAIGIVQFYSMGGTRAIWHEGWTAAALSPSAPDAWAEYATQEWIAKARSRYIYYPGGSGVPEAVAPNIRNHSYTIAVELDLDSSDAEGVLFSHGARFGGHALYLKSGKLEVSPWPLAGGTVSRVIIDVSGEPFSDLAQEAAMASARD